jgi:hypothetical protein
VLTDLGPSRNSLEFRRLVEMHIGYDAVIDNLPLLAEWPDYLQKTAEVIKNSPLKI